MLLVLLFFIAIYQTPKIRKSQFVTRDAATGLLGLGESLFEPLLYWRRMRGIIIGCVLASLMMEKGGDGMGDWRLEMRVCWPLRIESVMLLLIDMLGHIDLVTR